jgi:hypothetical protein
VVCGAGLRERRHQWKPGLGRHEQEFGLRGTTEDERCKDEEEQGRAHINSVCGSSEDKSAWRENGLVSFHLCSHGQDIAQVEVTPCMLRTVIRAAKCAGEVKIWLRVLSGNKTQK